jgi:predicted RNase H-like HicB family nuclease
MKFLVVIHKDNNSDYGVTVPDLPGCFSAGSTVEEALENTKEAIALHLEDSNPTLLKLFQDYITHSSIVKEKMEDNSFKDGLFVFVEVEL